MKKNYSEKLQDPRWQKKRLEVFERDSFKCQLCDDTEATLHVHHKTYEWNKNPWEYSDDNFQTLCWLCHKAVEHLKEGAEYLSPVKTFKVDYPEQGITFLNMSAWYEEGKTGFIEVFKHENGLLTHLVPLTKETIDKMQVMLHELAET